MCCSGMVSVQALRHTQSVLSLPFLSRRIPEGEADDDLCSRCKVRASAIQASLISIKEVADSKQEESATLQVPSLPGEPASWLTVADVSCWVASVCPLRTTTLSGPKGRV